MKNEQIEFNQIIKALKKRAFGGIEEETKENLQLQENGDFKVVSKTINKKVVLPDTTALLKLFEIYEKENLTTFENMSLEELETEKERLLKELNSIDF